ncbi:MAG: ferredoxin family protein [Clostridia bacterium]|nr:ferredoxin family protein [Clostridia bacterium]
MNKTPFSLETVPCSVSPLSFDPDKCVGCNACVEACQIDVLVPAGAVKSTPFAAWPGECWYCGACVMECPVSGAVTLRHPLMNQARFVEAESVIKRV